jgi:tripartite-type tricarboxylate transporter receptor subunit TctC
MFKKVITAALMALAFGASAQESYPNRPVKLLVAYGAGGSTDQIARAMGVKLGQVLGQPIVIENKPGASGLLAANLVAKSPADGYTLGVTAVGIFRAPHIEKTQVDPMTDLSYVAMINEFSLLIAVKKDAPWKDVKELVTYAQQHPGKLSFASPGVLSTQQLALSQLGGVASVQWTHVPYKGDAEAITATLGGFTQFVGASNTILPFVESGEMRVLASMNESRLSEFPTVPTLKESGYPVVGASSLGIIGPKGLKPEVLRKLEQAFAEVTRDKQFLASVKALGVEPRYMNSEQYTRYARETYDASKELVTRYGRDGK